MIFVTVLKYKILFQPLCQNLLYLEGTLWLITYRMLHHGGQEEQPHDLTKVYSIRNSIG